MIRHLIKKILKESNEFDWAKGIPSYEDSVVYLLFNHGKPDWESVEDALEEDPDWIYWPLFLYMTKDEYTTITGSDLYTTEDNWDAWDVYGTEGAKLLDYFYDKGFDRKQSYGHDTAFDEGESDGDFTVSNRDYFCKHLGNHYPELCGRLVESNEFEWTIDIGAGEPIHIGGLGETPEDVIYLGDRVSFIYTATDTEMTFTVTEVADDNWGVWGDELPDTIKYYQGGNNWINRKWVRKVNH